MTRSIPPSLFASPLRLTARLAAALSLAACSSATDPSGPPPERTALPRELAASERRVLTAGNELTWTLLRQVSAAQPGKTVVLSPLSASMALGMTLNGAAGGTLDGMRLALGLGNATVEEIDAGYASTIALLRELDPSVEFKLANAIFHRASFPFHQSFLDAGRQWFGAEIRPLDFASPAAVNTINDWVKGATQGRITSIVESLRADDVMYLLNAIYFKGRWRAPFDPRQTADGEFRAADGSRQPARFMYRGGTLHAFGTPEAEGAVLPYGNGAFAMTLILPRDGVSVESVAASMSAAKFADWQAQAREVTMDLYLPRFTVAYERTLNDDLAALGMADAFAPSRADFSRMSTASLYIGVVKQKTWIQVDEEGTEAAAVTGVGVRVTSLPPSLRFDRPFLFVISDRLSGAVLFVGKVAKI